MSQIMPLYASWSSIVADYRYVNGVKEFFTYCVYRHDTELAGKPIIDSDDILYDYSGFLTLKITPENCFNWTNEANIQGYHINTLSFDKAAKMMEDNIRAAIHLEKLKVKAAEVQEIVKAS